LTDLIFTNAHAPNLVITQFRRSERKLASDNGYPVLSSENEAKSLESKRQLIHAQGPMSKDWHWRARIPRAGQYECCTKRRL